jgi:hypothetical protein
MYYSHRSLSKNSLLIILFTLFFILGCERPAPAGRIRIRNDIQDSTYNVINVSGGGAGFRLKPGETALMPRGTTTMYWSRAYKDYTRSYTVECPRLDPSKSGITVKMIDVHLNRIAGGCVTTAASK